MKDKVAKLKDIICNAKKEILKHRLYIFFQCIALGMIIGGIGYYKDELKIEKNRDYLTCSSVTEDNNVLLSEGEIVQEFTAEQDALSILYFWIRDCSSQNTGTLTAEIIDQEGVRYYEETRDLGSFGDDIYCWVAGIPNSVIKGKNYALIVKTEGISDNAKIKGVKNTDILDSIGGLFVNGREEENSAIYMLQTYPSKIYWLASYWGVLWIVAATLGIIIVTVKLKIVDVITQIFIGVWDIVAAFFSIELLQGNLFNVKINYICINLIIIFGMYLILYSLLKYAAKYITLLVCTVIGIANYYVKQFRGTELQIIDVKSIPTAISVAGNYNFAISPIIYTVILVGIITLGMMTLKRKECYYEKNKGYLFKIRSGAAVAGIFILLVIYNIYVPREAINWFDWSNNFTEYGWNYANMIILKNAKIQEPEGYSDERIKEILENVAIEENTKNIVPQNIIVIMNESLSDLGNLGQLDTNRDYMPFIHGLESSAIKGNLYVSTFGGNTARTEYEFLTGNTNHFFPQGTVPYSTLCEDREEGMCRILQQQGYYTVAMHPYGAKNWNRDKVYTAMGFEEFLSEEDYLGAEYTRNYVSDKSDYDKIIEYVENDGKNDKLFVFNVTMQNHGGYADNNGEIDKTINVENFESSITETYLSLVYESDKAFEYLLDYFSEFDEPTLIVMFGDHLPQLSNNVYESIYGKNYSDLSAEERNDQYITPYIIWTNYESNFEPEDDISANYLGSYVLKCAGLRMPEYNKYLLDLMDTVPAIGQYGFLDQNKEFIPYEESDESIFDEYRILQYMRVQDRKSKCYGCFAIQN